MSLTKPQIKEILEAIEGEHLSRLNEWETSFFESVKDTFDRHGNISLGQNEKLEQIWVKLP